MSGEPVTRPEIQRPPVGAPSPLRLIGVGVVALALGFGVARLTLAEPRPEAMEVGAAPVTTDRVAAESPSEPTPAAPEETAEAAPADPPATEEPEVAPDPEPEPEVAPEPEPEGPVCETVKCASGPDSEGPACDSETVRFAEVLFIDEWPGLRSQAFAFWPWAT